MYQPHDPFLRNHDGMIDFDRYRSDATGIRRQAMRDTSALRSVIKLVVVVVLLLGMVAVAPPKRVADTTSSPALRSAQPAPLASPALFLQPY